MPYWPLNERSSYGLMCVLVGIRNVCPTYSLLAIVFMLTLFKVHTLLPYVNMTKVLMDMTQRKANQHQI